MGGQIEPLASSYRVIAIDSRGNGKSSNTAPVLTYEMMSDDVVGVMDALKIERADIVGWSDGGNLGSISRGATPIASAKVVAFGANHTPPLTVLDPVQVKEFKDAKPDRRDRCGRYAACTRRVRRHPRSGRSCSSRSARWCFAQPRWSLEQLASIRAARAPHQRRTRPCASALRDRDEKRRSQERGSRSSPAGRTRCLWATPTP